MVYFMVILILQINGVIHCQCSEPSIFGLQKVQGEGGGAS